MNFQADVRRNLEALDLGDKRRTRRAQALVEKLARGSGKSLPQIASSRAEREAHYRLIENPHVKFDDITKSIVEGTLSRFRESKAARCIVAHDSTEMKFSGSVQREGLGLLPNGTQGFIAHVSLAITCEENYRDPIGIVAADTLFREKPKGRRSGFETSRDSESESKVWIKNILKAEKTMGAGKAVHVADRLYDSFELMHNILNCGARFVIRSQYDRKLKSDDAEANKLHELLAQKRPTVLERNVRLLARHKGELAKEKALKGAQYKRTPSAKRTHPARDERIATLHAVATTVTIKRPKTLPVDIASEMTLNVVKVFEPSPPERCQPVEWVLLTNEPIDTPEQVAHIIDAYRSRWMIEELFKAIKTGVGYEKLQVETRQSFLSMLGFALSLAAPLLRMRILSRSGVVIPAQNIVPQSRIDVIRYVCGLKLSENPTINEVEYAIAEFGGHFRQNGPPGWIILSRGLQRILDYEKAWNKAKGLA